VVYKKFCSQLSFVSFSVGEKIQFTALSVPPLVVRPSSHSYQKFNEVGMDDIQQGREK
jgi:hypothetical protein